LVLVWCLIMMSYRLQIGTRLCMGNAERVHK